jgi:hypothetical protein
MRNCTKLHAESFPDASHSHDTLHLRARLAIKYYNLLLYKAVAKMGKAKKTRKFAEVKRLLHPKDLKPCVFALRSAWCMYIVVKW